MGVDAESVVYITLSHSLLSHVLYRDGQEPKYISAFKFGPHPVRKIL